MNKSCETCKHWSYFMNRNGIKYGDCGRIGVYIGDVAYVDAGLGEYGSLVTRHNFFCALWEPKEDE